MKHSEQQSLKAKNRLKCYYKFKEVDFYNEDNKWYLNCKDNVGESAFDVLKEIELTFKESLNEC